MRPAARLGDMHTCPMVTGTVPHVGGPILPPCAPTVLIAGMPAARVGDLALCAGPPDTIVMGSTGVYIAGKPAARLGDPTAHGGVIVAGCPTVLIGEVGAGGAGSLQGQTMSAARKAGVPFTSTDCDCEEPVAPGLRSPSSRHESTKVGQKTLAKERNTVIEPGVDVAGDVEAINSGKATRVGDTYRINERIYGKHDGTLYPISGPGFHQLGRGAFKALGIYNQFGNTSRATEILTNMAIGQAERDKALAVWRVGKGRS